MTARVVLACDGGVGLFPCRQAIPVGEVLTGRQARAIAAKQGWSSTGSTIPCDFCPGCTKRMQER